MRKYAVSLITIAALIGCDKKTDAPAGPAPQIHDENYSVNGDILPTATRVSQMVAIPIHLNNAKDYANEYNYRRILGLIAKNQTAIRAQSGLIDQIFIDGSSSVDEDLGKYTIHLPYSVSESDLVLTFTTFLQISRQHRETGRKLQAAMPHVSSVVDLVGVTTDQIDGLAQKLALVDGSVAFGNDPSFRSIELANFFAITDGGMVIDIGASADAMAGEIASGIRARAIWNRDIVQAGFLTSIGLNVKIQPGIFTGAELLDVIAFVKRNATTIRGTSTAISSFILGKQFDYDLPNATMLLDVHATEAVLKEHLLSAERPVNQVNFNAAKANLIARLSANGYTLSTVDMDFDATAANLSTVNGFLSSTVRDLDLNAMSALSIRNLELTLTEATRVIGGPGNRTLFIRLPTAASDVNSYLKSYALNSQFDGLVREITAYAAVLRLPLSMSFSNGSASATVIQELTILRDWMVGSLKTDAVVSGRVTSMTVVIDSPSSTKSSLVSGTFTVNLNDLYPDQFDKMLNPPSPTPTPVASPGPSPKPTPVPSPTPHH